MTSRSNGKPTIIGIGASAGGLEAIEAFFQSVPSGHLFSFIVVQHLSPNYKSYMPELLKKSTDMNIVIAEDGMRINEKTIYLCPPSCYITIIDENKIKLDPYPESRSPHFPIDELLTSMASELRDQAVGIVLSGNGTDGTQGMKAIRESGGMCIVQDETAKYPDMPINARKEGVVDFVLPPDEIPQQLLKNFDYKRFDFSDELLNDIFQLIHKRTNVDFAQYKRNSVIRRIERRMNLSERKFYSVEDYKLYLIENPSEAKALKEDLLIGVTHFFRDKEAFNYLEREVFPKLIEQKKKSGSNTIRVWVAGCSTGQEAYSIAILLNEEIKKQSLDIKVQIFATDVDKDAIKTASLGRFSEQVIATIPQAYLNKYFEREDDEYAVKKEIRKMIVFAPHNIAKDSPFVDLDMVSCRNVLIYFQAELQQRVLSLFHFALREDGYLFLGPSETLGRLSNLFGTINSKWNIFHNSAPRKVSVSDGIVQKKDVLQNKDVKSNPFEDGKSYKSYSQLDDFNAVLLDQFMEACVVIDEDSEVVFSSNSAQRFLAFPKNKSNFNIHNIVPTSLSVVIGAAAKKVKETQEEVTFEDINVRYRDYREYCLNVKAAPVLLPHKGLHYTALFFEEKKVEFTKRERALLPYDPEFLIQQRIHDMEQELFLTKQHLQNTIEELETSNEELQSTNEELIAANEELQSTNEELQSVNEELITVNNDYEKKIEELIQLNNDIDNLLINTNIATIFLDKEFNIKLFTPEASNVFNLIERDVGRPIHHISHTLEYHELNQDIQEVLYTTHAIEKELKSDSDEWFSMRIMPYRTSDNIIEGIVITLVNITELKGMNQDLQMSKQALEHTGSTILVTDGDGNIVYTNQHFLNSISQEYSAVIGHPISDIYDAHFRESDFLMHWNEAYNGAKWTGELSYKDREGHNRWEYTTLVPVLKPNGKIAQVIRVSEDITQRKKDQENTFKSEVVSVISQVAIADHHGIRIPMDSLRSFRTGKKSKDRLLIDSQQLKDTDSNRLKGVLSELLFSRGEEMTE
ncbi:CheR family methyltransferase [Falsibacillus albus]|uniref:PAS domain S-box protein n=1 Tax=Falsibacillus albus TaxID=2478915 RepID=A0A3L7JRH9_9BACI|nr:CheR family methyltransferase [Falsibacillus albus]RLQ93090.1 PAS domain S-box protein [Falsibacillus albus]